MHVNNYFQKQFLTLGGHCIRSAIMTLAEYLEAHKIPEAVFGEKIGKNQSTVGRYKRGEVKPPIVIIAKISEITKGKVQFRDWLET